MSENQNNPNQNPSGGPQFGTENQDKGGWGRKIKGWLNKYGTSVILPIVALLILAGGIYLYASQKDQVAQLPDEEGPAATSTEPTATTTDEETTEPGEETMEEDNQETTDHEEETTEEEDDQEEAQHEKEPQKEATKEGQIVKTAEAGEGVTHLARKAAREYLENNPKEGLTKEHKVYIEDHLKDQVGSKPLEVGEKVGFSKKQIQEAINASLQLNQNQLQNLQKYSQHINW